MYLSSNRNVKLDRTDNAWVPTIAAKQVVVDSDRNNAVVAMKNIESNMTEVYIMLLGISIEYYIKLNKFEI